MGKRGPAGVLDEFKRREICAVLTIGGSQAQAADYVGCSPGTITNTAKREPDFAHRLKRAKANCEKECLRNIFHTGVKSWRASAWLLERTRPELYEKVSLRRASGKQLDSFWDESTDDILLGLPEEQQTLLRGRFEQASKKYIKALPSGRLGGQRRKDDETETCDMDDPTDEPEAAGREPAGAGGRSAAQPPAELTLPPVGPPTPLGLPVGQPQDSPVPSIEEQRAAARQESLLRQDDNAANRGESCLWDRKPDMPNLAIMPGFANPLASPDDEEDGGEYYAKAERGCEQLAAMERESRLRKAQAAEDARAARQAGGTAIVSLLLAWLPGWLCAPSRPDFQSGRQYVSLSSLTNARSICPQIAPSQTTLAPPQPASNWRAVSAGLKIRPTAERPQGERESSAPPASKSGALRLRGDYLERLPCDVPPAAFKVPESQPFQPAGRGSRLALVFA